MLLCTEDEDDDVAAEACEFWLQLTEEPQAVEVLAPYLPRLIPLLLNRMQYSEFDLLMMKVGSLVLAIVLACFQNRCAVRYRKLWHGGLL